jgi:hypothetical protein
LKGCANRVASFVSGERVRLPLDPQIPARLATSAHDLVDDQRWLVGCVRADARFSDSSG